NGLLLSACVHMARDTGTRAEGTQEEFVRIGASITAAVRDWFVRLEHVRSDGYILGESHRFGIYRHISGHISSHVRRSLRHEQIPCMPSSNPAQGPNHPRA